MPTAYHLPTLTAATWTVTALRDSLLDHLSSDIHGREIRLFFYAVTESGWLQVRRAFRRWLSRNPHRKIVAYVGTDHAITEAEAIRRMVADGVAVRLMTAYRGTFHPKVIWLRAERFNLIWIGSNNLTRDGLLNNIEFAAMLKSKSIPHEFQLWATELHSGSVDYSNQLLDEYETERRKYGERRVSVGTFTWSRREESEAPRRRRKRKSRSPQGHATRIGLTRGDLIVEVMPRETGQDGKQIQLPMAAATTFFGIEDRPGGNRFITLIPSWINDPRQLTMTIFANHTVRLVIRELDYRDRPCVLLFKRRRGSIFTFDIVARSAFPARYRELLNQCEPPTRAGSRRWGVVA